MHVFFHRWFFQRAYGSSFLVIRAMTWVNSMLSFPRISGSASKPMGTMHVFFHRWFFQRAYGSSFLMIRAMTWVFSGN